jgi:DNA repair protein RecO (recombination protein O)
MLYSGLRALLLALQTPGWAEAYVRWELALLRDLGFGLDLTTCAATGRSDALVYVSPRTGRAVSEAAGEPYRDRLLPLPAFLLEGEGGAAPGAGAGATGGGVIDGLRLTGHFLEHHVFAPHGWRMPAARTRLVDRLKVSDTISRV